MAAKFEVFTDKAGEYRFRLKAANGEIILASEGYKQKAGTEHGILSVKHNALDDAHYERKTTHAGKAMFNLKARNGEVIGTSEQYESEAGRDKGIEAVKKAAPDAAVHDLTH